MRDMHRFLTGDKNPSSEFRKSREPRLKTKKCSLNSHFKIFLKTVSETRLADDARSDEQKEYDAWMEVGGKFGKSVKV